MSSTTYSTPGTYTFTLPSNIDVTTPMGVSLIGAAGGTGYPDAQGGQGGTVVGTLSIAALTPGTSTITVNVGGPGQDGQSPGSAMAGGYNGGGSSGNVVSDNGSGSGAGATDIRIGGTALANRVAVAGGGGGGGRRRIGGSGSGTTSTGGAGGAGTGGAGQQGVLPGNGGSGGGGGTAAAGGAAGAAGTGGTAGTVGSSGQGGNGANAPAANCGNGAGGGGGYFGGGGGGSANATNDPGGGGGGSNYVGGLASVTTNAQGGGTFAATVTLTYNLVPNQPTLNSPVGSSSVDLTQAITCSWTPSDPDVGDTQSKADLQWRIGSGAWTVIASASASAVASYAFAANAFAAYAGQTIEWQVRTYDSHNAAGPWSASGFFIPRTKPTAPTYVSTPVITSSTPTVRANMADGAVQYQYQVTADASGSPGAVLFDSGAVAISGAPTSLTASLAAYTYTTGGHYHILFRYAKYAGVWSNYVDSGSLTATISGPLQPTVILTGLANTGSVRVDITNPGSDPNAPNRNDVYRTDTETGEEIRIATPVAINGTFTDWTPGFNKQYRYRVVAVNASGAFTSSA